jgi:L-ascorbate metabolism protein UlaG (beta-lactamase superfamily)
VNRLAWALLLAAGGLGVVWLYLFGYTKPPVDPAWQLTPTESAAPPGAVTVRFSGTTTLLFSDGETAWMIDGWFTRPGPLQTLFGDVEPDLQAISYGLEANAVTELAAIIPVHSHYDHAMDSPEVARRTGAVVIGSEASANIARGWGLPEEQIRVVADREQVRLGDFQLTFLESRHLPYPDPELVDRLLTQSEIPEPLVPPASIYDYKLGKAYALHIAHPAGTALVVGSAGFIPGLLEDYDVDQLFLGIGALGSQTAAYREDYWRHTVAATSPEQLILIHWDSLTSPIDGPLVGEVRAASLFAGGAGDTLGFLAEKARSDPALRFATLPRFEPVLLMPPR